MKKLILLHVFSLVLVLHLVAQRKVVSIHGVVKDTSLKTIEISYLLDAKLSKWENKKLDVVDGTFYTSIQIPFPVEVDISYGNRHYGKNYIYNDSKILIDSLGKPQMIGSTIQDEYNHEFLPFFQSNDKLFDSVISFRNNNYEKYGADFPKQIQDSATRLREKYCRQRSQLLGKYIKLHPNSYVALWDISYFVAIPFTHPYFDFQKLFSFFSSRMQQQSFINVLKGKIEVSARMQVGQIFPQEFFKGYEKMQSKIKSDNQYYLIDFWYSHCGPCVTRFPKLKELYDQFHGKGFDIVSISVDKQKDKKDYLDAITKYGLTWKQIWDKDGLSADKFNIHAFPTYILLDKDGRILNSDIRDSELEAFLKENLRGL